MPTFAFLQSPQSLTFLLRRQQNAPLPVYIQYTIHSFGIPFNARLLSMPGRSTSELLRTL